MEPTDYVQDTENGKDKRKSFFSNATGFGLQWLDLKIGDKPENDIENLIAELNNYYSENYIPFFYQQNYISLLDEGALEVSLVFKANEQLFSVFFIYSTRQAQKYLDAREKIVQTSYPNALYFSTIDISQIKQKQQCTRTFRLSDLKFDAKLTAIGEYAMWWADSDENRFSGSETCLALQNLYEATNAYESVFTAYLLDQLEISDNLTRAVLPEVEKVLTVSGPEKYTILIVLSKQKGIRFLFPVKSVNRKYREHFLQAIFIEFLSYRLSLQQQSIVKDRFENQNPSGWFENLLKQTLESENSGIKMNSIENNNITIY